MEEGLLKDLVKGIREMHPTKNLIVDQMKCGSKRKTYICKDCNMFMVTIAKRGEMWRIKGAKHDHGNIATDGLIEPCLGSKILSTRDVCEDAVFQALMNTPTDGGRPISSESICRALAEKRPLAKEPSIDVIKKARVRYRKDVRNEAQPVD